MLAGLVPSEVSFLGLQMALFSVSSHLDPSVHVCVLISSYKDINHIGLGPTLVTSFSLIHLHKRLTCLPIQSHSELLGVRISTYELGGGITQLLIPAFSCPLSI